MNPGRLLLWSVPDGSVKDHPSNKGLHVIFCSSYVNVYGLRVMPASRFALVLVFVFLFGVVGKTIRNKY